MVKAGKSNGFWGTKKAGNLKYFLKVLVISGDEVDWG